MKSATGWNLCVALLILIAVFRIAATYHILSATTDEPAHLACGMLWLDKGKYGYEFQHPPLARVSIAVVPYLHGVRSFVTPGMWREGWAILYADNNDGDRLAWARMGTMPFLILGAVIVWLWGKRWFGNAAGLWAVLLFLSLPPILAHAGLATLDMAAATSLAAALYQLMRWREEPTMKRAAILAVAIAFAVLCKFSTPAFLVASALLGLFGLRGTALPKLESKERWRQAAAMTGIFLFLIMAGYRFKVQPIIGLDLSAATHAMDRVIGHQPQLMKAILWIFHVPTPFGGLLSGLWELFKHDARGNISFFLGKTHFTGVWYYFPVVLLVKTPIGFLLLGLGGIAMALFRFRETPWQHRVTALFVFAILLVCMTSRINRGIRHILPIYPPLAVMAGAAAAKLAASRKTSWIAVGLAGWVIVASVMTHPDYLTYFNEFARSHPETIVVDSDLDWGQDLGRLSQRLRDLRVDRVGIKYWGGALIEHAGLPPYTVLEPNKVTEGYVAISLHDLNTYYALDGSWAWLHDRQPLERIGHSINLYYIQPSAQPSPSP